jgi:ACS family glucarate transporter-like MFS transporter
LRFPRRYQVVILTFLLSILLYVDRVCISAAKGPVAASLGFTDTQMGWVLSAFALGYALFQTPSGLLADRLGPRRVLAAVVTFWSIFTGLTALAWNYLSMLLIRFLFGVGEAGAFPGMARAVFSWMPMTERGRVQGINFSGSRLGAAFALPGVAWMIEALGWRSTFLVLCLVGFAWAAVWYLWFRDEPSQHRSISREELQHIESTRQKITAHKDDQLSAGRLFGSWNVWLAMSQYFCSNFTFFFCLTWLYPHVQSKFQLGPVEAGMYAATPLIFGALGNWLSGWLVDWIYSSGSWPLSRRLPAIIGFGLAAAGLVASVYMDSVEGAIVFLSMAIFGADMTLSPSWSVCIDIGRRSAGAVSGTMNMAGNVGSFVTALAFPYLSGWTGSEVPFFFVGAGLNIIAIFLWLFIRPEHTLEDY